MSRDLRTFDATIAIIYSHRVHLFDTLKEKLNIT